MSAKDKPVFMVFCLWTFVLLCRPQDIFTLMQPVRPAFTVGFVLMIFAFLYSKNIDFKIHFKERQVKYYFSLILIMIIGIPFSLYPRLSFMLIFNNYMSIIVFFLFFINLVNTIKRLLAVLLIGCFGSGLYLTFALVTGKLGTSRLSFSDTFDPNDLAFFALSFLWLNLIFISRGYPFLIRVACIGSFFVGVSTVFLTGSRGGFLAFGLAMMIMLLMNSAILTNFQKIAFVVFGVFLLVIMPVKTERIQTLFSIEQDYNVQEETGRLAIWGIGLRAMVDNPVTGVGVGCFSNAVGLDRATRGADTLRWQTAHNSAIQIGAETGFIGLALFLCLSLNVIRDIKIVKKETTSIQLRKIAELGIVGFVGMFISAMFLSQAYSIYWVLYIAITITATRLLKRENSAVSGN
ncbi:O-antigen ligase family protein [Desulfuromonas sp. KJ2020]|uniref:O-antigen ligase family protein n=1 Tax=Desulfuromonas sp. KJ2020 TaxID=2919173 RepID=UPI0020A778AC|nr:O-antigen ligase family protein [Desulfuromonas sp. KJ2020]MCP3178138.1 O-antigen ligase family protein [Desulfuromonas sp. KJ2020]